MSTNTVVNEDHYDVDTALEELSRRRYSMPPVVIAALRQAGQKATQRILDMVTDDNIFSKLSDKDKMKLLELVLDRAYGRAETATSNELANARLNGGDGDTADHAKQLEELEARELAHRKSQNRKRIPSPAEVIAQIDREHGFSVGSPYLPTEEDAAEGGIKSHTPPQRNRPVPPQNVVNLRRERSE